MIDGIVQFYVLSHIPDKIQGVTEMVLDRLPKSSRDDYVTDISKETQLSSLGANTVKHQNTFDLSPEDLSNKGLERFHVK